MSVERNERNGRADHLAAVAGIVVDPRLADVWTFLWEAEGGDRSSLRTEAVLGAALRMAYVRGYADAHAESDPGDLYRALGIREEVRPTRLEARRRRRA